MFKVLHSGSHSHCSHDHGPKKEVCDDNEESCCCKDSEIQENFNLNEK